MRQRCSIYASIIKIITERIRHTEPIARMIFVFLLKLRLPDFVLIMPAFERAVRTGL